MKGLTQFDPTPAPGAPAGTFLIIAKFDNISDTFPQTPVFHEQNYFFPIFSKWPSVLQTKPGKRTAGRSTRAA